MDFKLVDKKNIGVISLLILVIFLSQSRFFNFLIDSALGRAFLIAFIIFISCCNKIIGVVGVLLIIIIFNNSNIGILEGFDSSANISTLKSDLQTKIESKIDSCGNDVTPAAITPAPVTTTYTATAAPSTANAPQANLDSIQNKVQSKETAAKEGFDLYGTEFNIKKGKQSNSISVNHQSRNSANVSPYEQNVFSTSNYSMF
jgi:hypothetical protein